jgi:hypothetical protein
MSEIFFIHSNFLSDVITHTGDIAKHKKLFWYVRAV